MTPLYIFDLDGTLALIEHRRHFVNLTAGREIPDWRAFFAACVHDEPNWPVISTMNALLKSGADVHIWSGRSAEVMNETLAWLHRFFEIDAEEVSLCMRREGDYTPDEQLKQSWLEDLTEFDRRRLVAVFDDRQKVVDMWRANGVACFQVAPGEF
jgi:phosphoglycolate phosphatase-like HAD superfamily hydrolase